MVRCVDCGSCLGARAPKINSSELEETVTHERSSPFFFIAVASSRPQEILRGPV